MTTDSLAVRSALRPMAADATTSGVQTDWLTPGRFAAATSHRRSM